MEQNKETNVEIQQVMALVHDLSHALREERQEQRRQARQRRWLGGVLALSLLAGGWMLGNQGSQQA
ncbi:hypothetical protein, partial [Candidatus Magnetaquicoccus inordinatus]|uniref:hypothetical protein n=1 Tax=Candidatus Magnetaquicoccus inordinatus TaxID=2496818 RepID=UPI00102B5F86